MAANHIRRFRHPNYWYMVVPDKYLEDMDFMANAWGYNTKHESYHDSNWTVIVANKR